MSINSFKQGHKDAVFKSVFEGRLLHIERMYYPRMDGYEVRLVLCVPDTVAQDEAEVYKRVAKAIRLITE
jgi:hypothetical protein